MTTCPDCCWHCSDCNRRKCEADGELTACHHGAAICGDCWPNGACQECIDLIEREASA